MIAEQPPNSQFIRVFDDGGSYADGSSIRFSVGLSETRSRPGVAFLEVGQGQMKGDVWRAIDFFLGQRGFYRAEWEVVDSVNGRPKPRMVHRNVRQRSIVRLAAQV